MSDCERLSICPFFNDRMTAMPASAHWLKLRYCHDQFADCARFVFGTRRGFAQVPADLFPTQTDRALRLLAAAPGAEGAVPDPAVVPAGKPAPER
jgi:hypothetical protein